MSAAGLTHVLATVVERVVAIEGGGA